jgi:hypothetical protein
VVPSVRIVSSPRLRSSPLLHEAAEENSITAVLAAIDAIARFDRVFSGGFVFSRNFSCRPGNQGTAFSPV